MLILAFIWGFLRYVAPKTLMCIVRVFYFDGISSRGLLYLQYCTCIPYYCPYHFIRCSSHTLETSSSALFYYLSLFPNFVFPCLYTLFFFTRPNIPIVVSDSYVYPQYPFSFFYILSDIPSTFPISSPISSLIYYFSNVLLDPSIPPIPSLTSLMFSDIPFHFPRFLPNRSYPRRIKQSYTNSSLR